MTAQGSTWTITTREGPHFSLDIANCETPLQAFRSREATDAIRKKDPKWMERDTDD